LTSPERAGDLRYDGRVAVITGAGRGLGRAFAMELARRGAAVIVNDIGISADAVRYASLHGPAARYGADAYSEDVAERVAAEIQDLGGTAVANRADVADPAAAATVIEDAVAHFDRVDIVVNNAGVVIHRPFGELDAEDLWIALGVHLGGAFNTTRAAWPHLVRQGYGRVLNVGSVAGTVIGVPGHAVYDAAKGALAGLTLSLATEAARHGIVVNGLFPTADTRCSLSVARSYERPPGLTIDAVVPAACWLVHEACSSQGKFYLAGGGRMASVFTSVAEGYQATDPAAFSLESVAQHWDAIEDRGSGFVPADAADLAAYGRQIRERFTSGADESEGMGRVI
jgi:NAD(P)-dependent dehydrogenase (short-subunit alcohol dehydrogenase family)